MPGPAPTYTLPTFDAIRYKHGPKDLPTLSRATLNDWVGVAVTPQHSAAVKMFHRGDIHPEKYFFYVKSGIDAPTAHASIEALMSCFGVYERDVRIGNIAVALANWFDYKPGPH